MKALRLTNKDEVIAHASFICIRIRLDTVVLSYRLLPFFDLNS